jgi:homoserine/homoserine lactone efflux protein
MTWKMWVAFTVTEAVLCFTPGPAVLLVLSQALARGTVASIWSNLGVLGGNTIYFILSATGLGVVLMAS